MSNNFNSEFIYIPVVGNEDKLVWTKINEPKYTNLFEYGYILIFSEFCRCYPEKEEEYRNLLRINGGDYKLTVWAIEQEQMNITKK